MLVVELIQLRPNCFQTDHNLVEGEEIIYSNENNTSVGIGTTTATLVDKASYFAKIDNNRTIQLFESESILILELTLLILLVLVMVYKNSHQQILRRQSPILRLLMVELDTLIEIYK